MEFHMSSDTTPTITKRYFGNTKNGEAVDLYTLTNKYGMQAEIMTYGGTIVLLSVPDKNGQCGDIVLGFDNITDYEDKSPYFGCIVGRYGNRIADATFDIDGQTYTLAANNGENSLHGGLKGFDKVIWTGETITTPDNASLKLKYLSKDMEEGFPGNLDITVVYTLTNNNELIIDYAAKSDRKTICNLTNHSYFNLAGPGNGDTLDHILTINADNYTPTSAELITTGEIKSIKETPFDFTTATPIGKQINSDHEQIVFAGGYDHNWVLNKDDAKHLSLAATVYEPTSGRVMEVLTTEPGVQFYAGNFLDGTFTGKENKVYKKRYGFCLETQHYPDSPNQPQFPTTELLPGQIYETTTIYKFSVA